MTIPTKRTVVIFLDSMDAELTEGYIRDGQLPELARLMESGAYRRLKTLDHSLADSMQVALFTGCRPNTNGYHAPHRFHPDTYTKSMNLLSSFEGKRPFYDFNDGTQVLTFDLPSSPILEDRDYTQFVDWGAHAFGVGGQSNPPEAWQDLIDQVGLHPEHGIDFALLGSPESCEALYRRQLEGIEMRTRASLHVMDRYPWQFAMFATSETHTGAHYLLKHPGNEAFYERLAGEDPILKIYQATARMIQAIIDHVGPETDVLMVSGEGMAPNHEEVPNIAYLPEMLFRYNFPGRSCFDFENELKPLADDLPEEVRANWVMQVQRRAHRPKGLQRLIRKCFPEHTATRLECALKLQGACFKPGTRKIMPYQPAAWMEPYWPHMRAFAMSTFSDGYIRVNVKGREALGKVHPEDYATELDRITEAIMGFRNSKNGRPGIARVERVRETATGNPEGPDADLIVIWEKHPIEQLESSTYGKVGPLPALRAGVHNELAFAFATGPQARDRGLRENGHIYDIAPTIWELLGKDQPDHYEGESLLN